MDQVKNHKVNLTTAAVAVGLGFVSKRALNLPSVGANGFQPAITSFVVIAASAMAADYMFHEHKPHT